jgi:hypothetical protein
VAKAAPPRQTERRQKLSKKLDNPAAYSIEKYGELNDLIHNKEGIVKVPLIY